MGFNGRVSNRRQLTHRNAASSVTRIESVRNIDLPTVPIIVVDDGSTDRTADILRSFGSSVTVITKGVNEGKARSLNDAISSSSDGLVMIVDADCIVPRETVDLMARHLVKSDTIGAVTANPRVTKTSTFVEKLQAIEFSAAVAGILVPNTLKELIVLRLRSSDPGRSASCCCAPPM